MGGTGGVITLSQLSRWEASLPLKSVSCQLVKRSCDSTSCIVCGSLSLMKFWIIHCMPSCSPLPTMPRAQHSSVTTDLFVWGCGLVTKNSTQDRKPCMLFSTTRQHTSTNRLGVRKESVVNSSFLFHLVRGYEPGKEDHEFNPRLGNFFLSDKSGVAHRKVLSLSLSLSLSLFLYNCLRWRLKSFKAFKSFLQIDCMKCMRY